MKSFKSFIKEDAIDDFLASINATPEKSSAPEPDKHPNQAADKEISKLDDEIGKLKKERDEWENKQYKPNNKIVTPGGADNLNAQPVRIDQINQSKKRNRIKYLGQEIDHLQDKRQKLIDKRHIEPVKKGDTVEFYNTKQERRAGKVVEIHSTSTILVRIHTVHGETFIRPLNAIFRATNTTNH